MAMNVRPETLNVAVPNRSESRLVEWLIPLATYYHRPGNDDSVDENADYYTIKFKGLPNTFEMPEGELGGRMIALERENIDKPKLQRWK